MARTDHFFDVPKTQFQSSNGIIELPAFYKDVSLILSLFWVDRNRYDNVVNGTPLLPENLKPCRFFTGKNLVAVVFFSYRDSTLGPYNEVSLTSVVLPDGVPKPLFLLPQFLKRGNKWRIGSYFHDLPVTTEQANVAGHEVWGLPKFVTEIPFDLRDKSFNGSVMDPDTKKPIVTLSGAISKSLLKYKAFDLVLYSNHRGGVLKTITDVESKYNVSLMPGLTLNVGDSDHRMAQNLRALGLDGARPFVSLWSNKFRSRLNDGKIISEAVAIK